MSAQQKPQPTRSGPLPWGARAVFRPGKTRRQRQEQWRQQTTILGVILAVSVVASAVFIIANWQQVDEIKTESCAAFPQFCVPLAGGSTTIPALEASGARQLDAESSGVPGVVRGVDANGIPTIGDPSAPIHVVTVSDYACPHCQDYHDTDVPRFIEDYVLTGQATFGFVLTTGTGQFYSETASQAALCAGEQGAFWEMSSELFRLATSMGVQSAFSLSQIDDLADSMGLDSQKLVDCVSSAKYLNLLATYSTFAQDHGVTGTPTVLVSYDGTSWSKMPSRAYDSLVALTEAANRNAQ